MILSLGWHPSWRVGQAHCGAQAHEGHTKTARASHFFLSISGISLRSAFSTMTCSATGTQRREGQASLELAAELDADSESEARLSPGTHWNSVWVLLLDACGLRFPLICERGAARQSLKP